MKRLVIIAMMLAFSAALPAISLREFLPSQPAETAVIVCPGGSYFWLGTHTEGDSVARSLNQAGIAAYVLKYRTGGIFSFVTHSRLLVRGHQHPMPLQDVQEAIQQVRQLRRYRRVGVMGFSAGGHLVLSAGVFGSGEQRPDFVASCYPVVTMSQPCVHKRSRRGLLGDSRTGNEALRDQLSLERHVPADCPPVFLVNCVDDPVVDYRNSVLLDSALTAAGVKHQYVQFQTGGHGFGASERKGTAECRQWKQMFLEWIRTIDN